MGVLNVWQDAILVSWVEVWSTFLNVIPSIFGAILVFAVGLVLAYWLKRLVTQAFKMVRFEKFAKLSGADSYLSKADIKYTLGELIGTIVEWLVILIFFLAVVDILGLSVVSQVLAGVLGYIPNVIAAAFIIALGAVIAGAVDGFVRGSLTSVDPSMAKPIGKISRWVILIIAIFAAIDQLAIAQGLIATFFQGLTYTIVLVVGLSVGLGAKDLVSKVLNDWYEKIKK